MLRKQRFNTYRVTDLKVDIEARNSIIKGMGNIENIIPDWLTYLVVDLGIPKTDLFEETAHIYRGHVEDDHISLLVQCDFIGDDWTIFHKLRYRKGNLQASNLEFHVFRKDFIQPKIKDLILNLTY